MATETWIAKQGQSIFDICLNTYGTLDQLFKLMQDNDVDNINAIDFSQRKFNFDPTLIVDGAITTRNNNEQIIYVTENDFRGGSFDDSFDMSFD